MRHRRHELALRVGRRARLRRRDLRLLDVLLLCDVLSDHHHPHHLASRRVPRGRIQKQLHALPSPRVERQLKVIRLDPTQSVLQHLSHRCLELILDHLRFDKVPAEHLVCRVPCDGDRLLVPLGERALDVHPEDGRVCRLDEHLEVVGHARELRFARVELRDVLPHADDADDLTVGVATRRRVQQDLHPLALLGVQRELEVRRLLALQRVLQHFDHRVTILRANEIFEAPSDHLPLRPPRDVRGLPVPLGDERGGVDAKDGRVGAVDQPHEVVHLLRGAGGHRDERCDVKANREQRLVRLGAQPDVLVCAEGERDVQPFSIGSHKLQSDLRLVAEQRLLRARRLLVGHRQLRERLPNRCRRAPPCELRERVVPLDHHSVPVAHERRRGQRVEAERQPAAFLVPQPLRLDRSLARGGVRRLARHAVARVGRAARVACVVHAALPLRTAPLLPAKPQLVSGVREQRELVAVGDEHLINHLLRVAVEQRLLIGDLVVPDGGEE
mmetsp:Transcript_27994/g.67792  ORF Transcript_27994/g.67792 Transcript_27994/m.67792 type:complete len:500 (-) Transcript_27994:377-1876(-)